MCSRRGSDTCLVIDDDASVAAESGADGIHVGQDDMPVEEVRARYPGLRVVGLSTHNLAQACDSRPSWAGVYRRRPCFSHADEEDSRSGPRTAARRAHNRLSAVSGGRHRRNRQEQPRRSAGCRCAQLGRCTRHLRFARSIRRNPSPPVRRRPRPGVNRQVSIA